MPDGNMFSGSYYYSIDLWCLQKYEKIKTLRGHCDIVTCIILLENNDLIASGS